MPRDNEQVVLVDSSDREVGVCGKLQAHQQGGVLHRAFSVFVVNRAGSLLLQQRASGKYHFPGLWSNSCCGHPRPQEPVVQGAQRRLVEEMGISVPLRQISLMYYVATDAGTHLHERELDHLLIGHSDDDPMPDPEEAGDWKWIGPAELWSDVIAQPDRYTPWLVAAMQVDRTLCGLLGIPDRISRTPIPISTRSWRLLEAKLIDPPD